MKDKYIVKEFSHKAGVHCESSSLRDMFEFYGSPMSEARAFGLDGTMGFGFFDYSENFTGGDLADLPMFIGGKQDTINPKSLACRLLGIQLRKQSFTCSDKAWRESKELIQKNKPLMLQVDLGFLNYMELEDEDFHFGGHFITLGGYDESSGVAYVGETDLEDFQKVPINQLKKARGSEYGPSFMHPKNSQYSMMVRPDGKHPPVNAGLKLAIKKVVDHMLRPSLASNGLQGQKNFAENILKWDQKLVGKVKNPSTKKEIGFARLTFELMYGNIEEWGTGGALFRNLYKEFLKEIITDETIQEGKRAWQKSEIEVIEQSLPLISDSANKWTQFADILKNSTKTYKDNCLENINLANLSDLISEIRVIEEQLFSKLHQIKL
ncbi:MAG: DUF4872 domain-containing protein [Candidatus Lokiarchaeota archaeon]|nr:DUF4872 domain-containing protein [Candidatus Lokiarchaeota archaeon]MBD3202461.1 DUF4872 domain-containing protein [Candidatus Lokiarchaeota archaeon]